MDAMQLPWFFENIARIMFVNGGMMVHRKSANHPFCYLETDSLEKHSTGGQPNAHFKRIQNLELLSFLVQG